jgi:hypothetical protein
VAADAFECQVKAVGDGRVHPAGLVERPASLTSAVAREDDVTADGASDPVEVVRVLADFSD